MSGLINPFRLLTAVLLSTLPFTTFVTADRPSYLLNNIEEIETPGIYNVLNGFSEKIAWLLAKDGIPWDVIVDFLTVPGADPSEFMQTMVMFELPFIIVFAILILMAILLPLVGIIFCCSRCCGRCGGTRKEEKIRGLNRSWIGCMLPALLTICLIMGFSTYMTKPAAETSLAATTKMMDVAVASLKDVVTYVEGIDHDFHELAYDDLDAFCDDVIEQVSDFGSIVASPFVSEIIDQINGLDNAIQSFENDIVSFAEESSLFSTVNDTIAGLLATGTLIQDAIDVAVTNLTDIKADCEADPIKVGAGACSGLPDPSTIDVNIDFSSLEDVDVSSSLLTDAALGSLSDVREMLHEANSSIAQLAAIINNSTADITSDVEGILNDTKTLVQDMVNSAMEPLKELVLGNALTSTIEMLEDYQEYIHYYVTDFQLYTLLKAYSGFVVYGCLPVLFCIIGLVLGIACYDRDRSPNQQKSAANCGGMCSMCSGACGFLISFFVCYSAATSFLLGTHLTLICAPLQDLTLIEIFIDNPALNPSAATLNFGNQNFTISFADILVDCGEDKALAEVLGLTESGLLDLESLDMSENLPNMDGISDIISSSLNDLGVGDGLSIDSSLDGMSGAIFIPNIKPDVDMISSTLSGLDLAVTADDLQVQADAIRGVFPDMAEKVDRLAVHLQNTQLNLINPTISQSDTLAENLEELNTTITDLLGGTEPITILAQDFQDFLENDAEMILLGSVNSTLDGIVSLVDGFLASTTYKINNEIGQCGIVRIIYDSLIDTLCKDFCSVFNVLMVATVSLALCLMPFICMNVRIAKYFRRPTLKGKPKPRGNKIHPMLYQV